MTRAKRILIVLGMFGVAVFLVAWAAMSYVGSEPHQVTLVAGHQPGQPVHLVMQQDGVCGTGPNPVAHPTWVCYRILDPHTHQWVNTTLVQLPANTKINVTDYQFDSGSPLRNQFFGRTAGVTGPTLTGTTLSVINSNKTAVGHTFTVPTLGINVPLRGNNATAKNFCTQGPCSPSKNEHSTTNFSFTTPKIAGNYRFQCFIPCGAGRYSGFSTAMQTLGYMMGFLKVV